MSIDLIGIDRAHTMADQAGISPAGQMQVVMMTMMVVGGPKRCGRVTRRLHCHVLMIPDRKRLVSFGWQGHATEIASGRIFIRE